MPKWKTLGEDEWHLSEKKSTDKRYERVTEVISAAECEKSGWHYCSLDDREIFSRKI